MEPINLFAREIFQKYRTEAEKDASTYIFLKTLAPCGNFPKYKRLIEYHGILAEFWGELATRLSGGKVDYLKQWSRGEK